MNYKDCRHSSVLTFHNSRNSLKKKINNVKGSHNVTLLALWETLASFPRKLYPIREDGKKGLIFVEF